MRIKIIKASKRIAWYNSVNIPGIVRDGHIGNVFNVKPYIGEYAEPGECVQVTEGDWKDYLIETKDTELVALTRQEARERGYTYCGHPDCEWQNLREINDLEDEELEQYNWALFDIGSDCLTISSDVAKDSIIDQICEAECEIGCDSNMGVEALADFDWSELYKVIENVNKALSSATYHTMTKIQLLP